MAQSTLCLDDATQALVEQAAAAHGMSTSRWVAELVRRHAAREWPKECLDLAGRLPGFPLRENDAGGCLQADAPRLNF